MELKDKKTRIVFHNGLTTIGGTLIEIIYEESRIFFDFGAEFNPRIQPQPETLQEVLDLNLMEFVEGIFDKRIDLNGYEDKDTNFENTALFLSHIHLDHTKAVNFLREDIPIYALKGTEVLLHTLNVNDDFLYANNNIESNTREVIGLDNNSEISIGKIKVKLIPVDHDAYGSCGMKITTPDLKIAYTGDIRFHGYRKNDTETFCKENYNTDVLIMEGVSVSFDDQEASKEERKHHSEFEIINEIKSILANNKNKQITFNYYISNIERIEQIIKNSDRKVVLSAYYSYVLKATTGYESYYYTLDNNHYDLDNSNEISFYDLLEDTETFLFQLTDKALDYVDKLKENGIYIHTNATPLFAGDPAYEPFMKKFEDNKIKVEILNCSGHAIPSDLNLLIDLIQPKLLVPIHSHHPEKLENKYGNRLLPIKKQII